MADTLMQLDNSRKMSAECLLIVILVFIDFLMAEMIKLAKIAGVMHEADQAYSIRSTW